MGRNIRRILLSAALFALSGFFCAQITAPVWESRITLSLSDPAALEALPGAMTAEGVSARAIPGTDVMEAAVRADSPEEAQARLDAALADIPKLLTYLSLSPEWEAIATATRSISRPDPVKYALTGALLGALAAILWLLPPAKHTEMLNLGNIVKGMGKLSIRFLPLVLLTVFLFAGGSFLWAKLFSAPQYEARTLVRIGDYDPDTADGLSAAVLGLLDSQLADPRLEASRVGSTNLFQLTAEGGKPEEALGVLQNTIDSWPRLASHMDTAPSLTVLEAPALSDSPGGGVSGAVILGGGAAVGLWLGILFLLALPRREHMYADD